MATEVAFLPLNKGSIPDDMTSTAGQVLKDSLETLTEQKGFQRAYWGRELENPENLRLFVDWDSIDAHKKFTQTDAYKPFVDHMKQIVDFSKAELYHAHLTPHPAEAALADHVSPCTEILRVFFPTDYSEADQKKTEEDIKKLVKAIEDNSDKYTGSAGGWVEEEVSIPDSDEKGKVYLVLIGWKAMEDHMAFRDTQAFKDNIHYLREAKDLKKFHVVHYSGTMVQPGAGGVGDNSGYSAQEEVLNPQDPGPRAPKTRADGTTTKNNDDLKGAANSLKKERQGR